ncbi:uncharacterized protein LOC5572108 isoform X4 [Aedes aegypti]|uniref:uncharacterized protein LOC5572108 isoform X4 n=1 Tax=Aedes aegypti TaxID=7159 RepID=UPI000B7908CE|nr:uncharacterized protein LOC5572108 isoform X4 [Aedes aegypti]
MQLISLALACLFTIFHCQLIGALPNDSVLPMARNGRRTSTQPPDTRTTHRHRQLLNFPMSKNLTTYFKCQTNNPKI